MNTCNFGHGPYASGARFISIFQAAEKMMHLATDEYMLQLSERVCWDRGEEFTGRPLSKADVMESRVVRLRLPFAPWLGTCDIRLTEVAVP